jgi:ornithine cyclodeaminase/alanine dehydrogenase-like protein (mu-crystallin family)
MHIDIPQQEGTILIMPVYSPASEMLSLKTATLFSKNKSKQLPLLQAAVTLIDGTDGRILALLEGSIVTALRTGAASGVATDLLARQDSKIVAIFGAGIQGRTQLEAVCAIRDIEKALIFDPDFDSAKTFADEMSRHLNININPAENEKELLTADVICTATSSETPVFKAKFVAPGTHINAIGSYKPHVREIPEKLVLNSRIVMDYKKSCLTEAGDLVIPLNKGIISLRQLDDEIGEIISGKKASRKFSEEITLFKSVGHAIQDLATARLLYNKATKSGIGTKISL